MASLVQLQEWRESLLAARMRGVRSVRDQNGEEVVFSSDREMAAALAACDREIAGSTSSPPKTILFRTTKGL